MNGLEGGKLPAGILIRVSIHSNLPKSAFWAIKNQRGQKKEANFSCVLQSARGFLNQEVKGASPVMLF